MWPIWWQWSSGKGRFHSLDTMKMGEHSDFILKGPRTRGTRMDHSYAVQVWFPSCWEKNHRSATLHDNWMITSCLVMALLIEGDFWGVWPQGCPFGAGLSAIWKIGKIAIVPHTAAKTRRRASCLVLQWMGCKSIRRSRFYIPPMKPERRSRLKTPRVMRLGAMRSLHWSDNSPNPETLLLDWSVGCKTLWRFKQQWRLNVKILPIWGWPFQT